MGRIERDCKAFIDSIPASKLKNLPRKPQTDIHSNADFRLDRQQMTTAEDRHVLAVQLNKRPANPNLKKATSKKGSPVVGESIKVPSGEGELDPEEVRRQLKEAVMKEGRNR